MRLTSHISPGTNIALVAVMTTELQSTHNAAVLLLALGENEAATVLKHLDAKVVQRLGTAMAQLKSASRDGGDGLCAHHGWPSRYQNRIRRLHP
jgi:hypothetical protein